jgi:mono/diheme cytochrome c family protein
MLKGILLGIVAGALLVFAGVYVYFSTGHAPVATTSPEMPFERKFAAMALESYLDKQPHTNPEVPADEANFLAGAKVYRENCAVCHGLPGEPRTAIANGMFPKPPQLFRGAGVTDDEPSEIYWQVAGGIRLSGMPAFKEHLSDKQMWQVTLLLKNADKISPAVKSELAMGPPLPSAPPPGTAPATPEDTSHEHEHHH